MLRASIFSVLIAIGVAVTLLHVAFAPAVLAPGATDVQSWGPEELADRVMRGKLESGVLRGHFIKYNKANVVLVGAPLEGINPASYAYINLRIADYPPDMRLALSWTHGSGDEAQRHGQTLPMAARDSVWITTSELPDWQDDITSLSVVLSGRLGQTVIIESLALHPQSPYAQVSALLNDLTSFTSWRRDSMNNYNGATKLSPFYPAPLIGALLAISLTVYGLWCFLRHQSPAPDWRVVGLIILLCWLMLDLPWQYQLLQQARDTRQQFAGKTDEQKLMNGPDAAIYRAVTEAREHIAGDDARIFVGSSDSYTGLRSAYYFYPYNVFWEIRGRELPHRRFLRPGDYVFVAKPSAMEVSQRGGKLFIGRTRFDVEVLTNNSIGAFVRLR